MKGLKWTVVLAAVLQLSVVVHGATTAAGTTVIYGTMTFTDITYEADLANTASSKYTTLVNELKPLVDTLFKSSTSAAIGTGTYVFTSGLKATFEITLSTSVKTVVSDLETRVKSELTQVSNKLGTHTVNPASVSLSDTTITTTTTPTTTTTATTIPTTAYTMSMRITSIEYRSEYAVQTSTSYINLANSVDSALTNTCRGIWSSNLVNVEITGFRSGSVWTDFKVHLASSLGLTNTQVTEAIQNALSGGNLANLYTVDFGDDSSLGTAAIIGIVLGCVAAIVVIVIIVVCCVVYSRRQKKRRRYYYEQRRRLTMDEGSAGESIYDRRKLDHRIVPRESIMPATAYGFQAAPYAMYSGGMYGAGSYPGTMPSYPMLAYPQAGLGNGFTSLQRSSPEFSTGNGYYSSGSSARRPSLPARGRRHRTKPLGLRNARRVSNAGRRISDVSAFGYRY